MRRDVVIARVSEWFVLHLSTGVRDISEDLHWLSKHERSPSRVPVCKHVEPCICEIPKAWELKSSNPVANE